jgi:hypothetical protein
VKLRLLNLLFWTLIVLFFAAGMLWAYHLELIGNHGRAQVIVIILTAAPITALLCVGLWGFRESVRQGLHKRRCFWFGHFFRNTTGFCPECGRTVRKIK